MACEQDSATNGGPHLSEPHTFFKPLYDFVLCFQFPETITLFCFRSPSTHHCLVFTVKVGSLRNPRMFASGRKEVVFQRGRQESMQVRALEHRGGESGPSSPDLALPRQLHRGLSWTWGPAPALLSAFKTHILKTPKGILFYFLQTPVSDVEGSVSRYIKKKLQALTSHKGKENT